MRYSIKEKGQLLVLVKKTGIMSFSSDNYYLKLYNKYFWLIGEGRFGLVSPEIKKIDSTKNEIVLEFNLFSDEYNTIDYILTFIKLNRAY